MNRREYTAYQSLVEAADLARLNASRDAAQVAQAHALARFNETKTRNHRVKCVAVGVLSVAVSVALSFF